jgi:hypothetical protein
MKLSPAEWYVAAVVGALALVALAVNLLALAGVGA